MHLWSYIDALLVGVTSLLYNVSRRRPPADFDPLHFWLPQVHVLYMYCTLLCLLCDTDMSNVYHTVCFLLLYRSEVDECVHPAASPCQSTVYIKYEIYNVDTYPLDEVF
jgi:hypothetical protein